MKYNGNQEKKVEMETKIIQEKTRLIQRTDWWCQRQGVGGWAKRVIGVKRYQLPVIK